ncbi:hypothetical protein Pst134EA_032025 [Puccinia striiformis f. sp. tritici]|uniref:uncharacterized protein n=1 Tax=Puccinia striiformis f. sp. tritici TaxID=168172 RepID=UPI0020088BD7|nr:uncharacterized protein Pst134EA_032025 [Puccinia striiformis f. sp. tritici]KAH9444388.1 hypothetical protein Pst134EA_032025 [Puccinia striiformis f. sp. tritici]
MSDRQFTSQSERTPTWTTVDDLSEVRTVFIHRTIIHEFLSDDRPSVLDLGRKLPLEYNSSPSNSIIQVKIRTKSLAEWIKLDRNVITWLSSDPSQLPDQDCDEDVFEVTIISNTLKQIQKDLYTDFRRFIIAAPEDHSYADKNSLDGIELMKISELARVLSSPRPHLM